MSRRHLFESSDGLVLKCLRGLISYNPSLSLDETNRVVFNTSYDRSKVSLISGGGSGHEPAWTGYVGENMLAASVAGDIFASPSTKQIVAAIEGVPSDEGTILVVTNYTGDCLHFGLANEKAIARGHKSRMIICGDDVSVGNKSSLVGRRGLAGQIGVLKVMGGAAGAGGSLDDVYNLGVAVSKQFVSIAATLDHCHVPGRSEHAQLSANEVEIGTGPHNEPGYRKLSPPPSPQELVGQILKYTLDETDPDRGFVHFESSDETALLVSNFGGMSFLEMGALLDELLEQLERDWKVTPARIYNGFIETSLNAPAFSVSIVNITQAANNCSYSAEQIKGFFDAKTDTNWESMAGSQARRRPRKEQFVQTPPVEKPKASKELIVDPKMLETVIRTACNYLVEVEPDLTRWDTVMGDGDCGETVKTGATHLLAALDDEKVAESGSINAILNALEDIVESKMGGTLGGILGIFFVSLRNAIENHHSLVETEGPVKLWAKALEDALGNLRRYTPAKVGDRTVMDTLIPFAEAMGSGNFESAVEAARKGAEATKTMKPRLGRATYVGIGEGKELPPDPGAILRAADEIQDEDANVSRILCEHAYSLAQNLDPNSEGRGVLQFKTGLMSVIKQKLAKRDGGIIDRSQDLARLRDFYKLYREKHKADELREDEMKLRESGAFSGNLGELERKTVKRKRIFATLKVMGTVLEQLSKEASPEDAESFIPEELKRMIESDAAMTEDLVAYNIIPLDAPTITNAIVSLTEVQAAVSAISYFRGLPKLPGDFTIPATRNADMLDLLQYVFGFQKDNVSNQREHLVLLLANEQSRLGIPNEIEPKMDEAAVQKVFRKSLENYMKWCNYLCIQPVWSDLEAISKEKMLLFISLYFLIWGEAANVRFLPECLCYIFHHMARELDEILRQQIAQQANSCISQNGVSFLDQVIAPLYEVIAVEAANNDKGRVPHSAWRNYDDFNEYFWSLHCFELSWPWRKSSPFFQKPKPRSKNWLECGGSQRRGKTSFVEHRTFLHLYHSFHRLWIFLFMMFQGLTIIAFNNGRFNSKTIREVLSLGPTFVVMKFFESLLDIFMMYGAYATTRRLAVSRIFLRFLWFGGASVFIIFLYVQALQEQSKPNASSVILKIYIFVLGIYAGVHLFVSVLMRIPACHRMTNRCDRWPVVRFFKWMHQERHYVGRGMYESTTDFVKYMLFWLVILGGKFSFAYFLQIRPLVKPTRVIVKLDRIEYSWHDLVSKNNHNALTLASLWAPVVAIYLLDIHVFYALMSAVVGFLLGAKDRLGEIRSLEAVHQLFEKFPLAFMDTLHVPLSNRTSQDSSNRVLEKNKVDAARFSPFWNEIIKNLREEDYITNFEMELLLMPKNSGSLPLVQWPLFLLASKIFMAKDIAVESNSQDELWERISKDDYMKYAVVECYHTVELILMAILDADGRKWVERIYGAIQESLVSKKIHANLQLNKLQLVISRVIALTGILREAETPELAKGAVKAVQDLYDVVRHDIILLDMREHYHTWNMLLKARNEGSLFSKLKWPKDSELKTQIKRLHSLLTIKESAANFPRNLEARRRLEFFTNSLFMGMPAARPVREMMSFSVFTPYYSEIVLYSMTELQSKNEDGISILFYLQKIFPDEWRNFLARIGRDENALDSELFDNPSDILELRFWASYRGQTLARTVRGMMYYRKALMLQSYLERNTPGDLEAAVSVNDAMDTVGFELSPEARALADLKFTYVVTCQIYGIQKEEQKPEAADIALLMQRNEALRVAFIDSVETLKDGMVQTEFFSRLVKGDINGKDREIYSIKLPGDPRLGEGKPENQNHALIFTRGSAVQTIDMNQDNYFEEALKMRNLLEEFHCDHGLRPPTILGVREHIFTGSVSSLASFMSNQETSFVTLGQRVLANPLKVRLHYGHPDVFDRVFHITRGGLSKASRVINISEDIFAGFNSTLRQGNVTHHEYIQVGKGRDVGLNQIALFEGKVAGGNGEQVLSRDVYRLGQLFDFFRMLSFYFTTVGYYFCTMLTVLTVYIFLYGKAYLALSGVGETIQDVAQITKNVALTAALNTQFLVQIGVFTAVPMILGFILEKGFLRAVVTFITMQLQLGSVFFTFSLGTKTHYFGRTILHGGARYQATGRGFVVCHIKFSENYRLYSRSHFVKGLEVVLLLLVYLAYGYNEGGALFYVLLTVSSWFMALSWLFAPYLFNPSGFEWQKTVEDFKEWTNWLFYRGGIGVKGEESWEAWWDEELAHIRTVGGRLMETILSLRFFIFQYGIVYKLHVSGTDTSLTVYGLSWVVLAVLIILFKVFTFSQKISVNFQLLLRFIQGLSFMLAVAGLAVAVIVTKLSVPDVFACILAFVPTGWGIISIATAWKPLMKKIGIWKSIRSIARLYDAGMGMLIFMPIALFSWFPFVSTFQTRLMFNQAFSRGLEISLILAGNNPNNRL